MDDEWNQRRSSNVYFVSCTESVDLLSEWPSPSWASTSSVLPIARARALDEEGSDGMVFVLGAIVRVGETDAGSSFLYVAIIPLE
jgi:hypothetical protein